MSLVELKCDNKDGTINWRRRAKIAVLVHMMCKGTKKALLSQIKSDPKFKKLVSTEWDRVKNRIETR